MKATTQILDCTLRDGAYLIDKEFGENNINGIISGLVKSDIDIIEIGFLQDEGFGEGKVVFKNSADAARYVPKDKGNHLYTVLADYSRYSIENLDVNKGNSIDAVRACFFKHEREDVLSFCKAIKDKGYLLFVQPVDILGYDDYEILDLVNKINDIEPYCFSIVDTFGSMYEEDLKRLFSLINHNLAKDTKIGFHSHNNLQMSSALSQAFINMSQEKRSIVIDSTLMGMGRGAGNTPTELLVQYINQRENDRYNMDALLDIMDTYMEGIKNKCSWGYNTPYFVAGCYSSHVNNVSYLKEKNSISSKGMRHILCDMDAQQRKRYDYELLKKMYVEYVDSDFDDETYLFRLKNEVNSRNILIIAPGKTAVTEAEKIRKYILDKTPIVIAVNFIPKETECDYIYFSNQKRYDYWKDTEALKEKRIITASNIEKEYFGREDICVNFRKLIKGEWHHMDNSVLLLLRLLDQMEILSVGIAGFDGYTGGGADDYALSDFESEGAKANAVLLNNEIKEMISDFMKNRLKNYSIKIITSSRFEEEFLYEEKSIN